MAKTEETTIFSSHNCHLRGRALKDGSQSLFLVFCDKDGRKHYEFLKGLRLPKKGTTGYVEVKRKAEKIWHDKVADLESRQFNVPKQNSLTLGDFLNFYKEEKQRTGRSKARSETIEKLIHHIKEFGQDKKKLSNIDDAFLRSFLDYLQTAKSFRHTINGKTLSSSTQKGYFETLVAALNFAVKRKLIAVNPNLYLDAEDKKSINRKSAPRVYLTHDEVKQLIDTPCRNEEIKRAFLFGCCTGLRISDIRNLTWKDVVAENGNEYLRITVQKTQKPQTLKLNQLAMKILSECERERLDGLDDVFCSLPFENSSINPVLKAWAKAAGIQKDISNHTARHTFAVAQITAGTSIYTLSKLLGHGDISTTQIYADLLSSERDEAFDRIDKLFEI